MLVCPTYNYKAPFLCGSIACMMILIKPPITRQLIRVFPSLSLSWFVILRRTIIIGGFVCCYTDTDIDNTHFWVMSTNTKAISQSLGRGWCPLPPLNYYLHLLFVASWGFYFAFTIDPLLHMWKIYTFHLWPHLSWFFFCIFLNVHLRVVEHVWVICST